MFTDRRVLVTGGAGFLGSHFIQRLRALGARVRATTHRRPAQVEDPGVEFVPADLTRMEGCQRVVKDIDFVFMCAASTAGAAVMTSTPLVQVTPNVVMNAQMLEAAYAAGVNKFLFVSSSAAYPPTEDHPAREEEMFQGDPYEVYFSVGWMKRYSEILCRIYAEKIKRPMATVIVRPSNVYGPFDKFDFERSHVTAALLRRVAERQRPLEVWGSGHEERDLIFVDDFIEGALRAFERTESHDVFNIASGQTCSVREILKTLCDVDHFRDPEIRFLSDKPATIARRSISTAKAEAQLGFRATMSLAEGLRRTLAWYRQTHPTHD